MQRPRWAALLGAGHILVCVGVLAMAPGSAAGAAVEGEQQRLCRCPPRIVDSKPFRSLKQQAKCLQQQPVCEGSPLFLETLPPCDIVNPCPGVEEACRRCSIATDNSSRRLADPVPCGCATAADVGSIVYDGNGKLHGHMEWLGQGVMNGNNMLVRVLGNQDNDRKIMNDILQRSNAAAGQAPPVAQPVTAGQPSVAELGLQLQAMAGNDKYVMTTLAAIQQAVLQLQIAAKARPIGTAGATIGEMLDALLEGAEATEDELNELQAAGILNLRECRKPCFKPKACAVVDVVGEHFDEVFDCLNTEA